MTATSKWLSSSVILELILELILEHGTQKENINFLSKHPETVLSKDGSL